MYAPIVKPDAHYKTACMCAHCGIVAQKLMNESYKCPLYCSDCNTKEKREAIDAENNKDKQKS